jgi:hypothetical protein
MKTTFSFFCLIFLVLTAFAQSPFSGGNGGGYAMASWKVEPVELADVQVFPTQVSSGDLIQVRVKDLKNKLEIRITDLLGRELWKTTEFGVQGEQTRHVMVPALAQGIYLVDVRRDGRQQIFHFFVQR